MEYETITGRYYSLWLGTDLASLRPGEVRCVYSQERNRAQYGYAAPFDALIFTWGDRAVLSYGDPLTYTLASNVGVIVSIAPFFAAIFNCLLLRGERPDRRFFAGFLIAMAGICLLSFGGAGNVSVNPAGDFLAACAAVLWALYSTLTKKISSLGVNTILTTRRVFFYGLIFMLPALSIFGFDVSAAEMMEPLCLGNLLFLGLGASALCFVTWGLAVSRLGSVSTCVYIYMVPVITAAASALILGEVITGTAMLGIALTLAGLFLSESRNLLGNRRGEKDFSKRKVCDGD